MQNSLINLVMWKNLFTRLAPKIGKMTYCLGAEGIFLWQDVLLWCLGEDVKKIKSDVVKKCHLCGYQGVKCLVSKARRGVGCISRFSRRFK